MRKNLYKKGVETLAENITLTKKEPTLLEELHALIDKYRDVIRDISIDYIASPGQLFEINTAFENLKNNVPFRLAGQEPEVDEKPDFDTLFSKMKDLPQKEICTGDLLDICDDDEIAEYYLDNIADGNDIRIHVNNLADRNKLENFIKDELYPFYSDQQEHVFL